MSTRAPETDLADKAPSLRRNVAFGSIGAVVASASSAFMHWLVVRAFGIEVHGNVVWLLSVYWAIVTASDLGLTSTVGLREVAANAARSPARIGEAVVGPTLVTVAVSTLLAALLVLFPEPFIEDRALLTAASTRWAALWIVGHAIVRACWMAATALERMGTDLLMRSPLELGRPLVAVLVVLAGLEAQWLFVGWAVTTWLSAAIAMASTWLIVREAGSRLALPRPLVPAVSRLLRRGLPYFPQFLGVTGLPVWIPLLGGAFGEGSAAEVTRQVSVLQICSSLALVPRLLGLPLSTAILVRLVRLEGRPQTGGDPQREVLDRATRWAGALGAASVVGSAALGSIVLGVVYGAEYAAHASTL
ncbi:MAG: hypothetical protein H5U40_09750, partial [Polyangiaceae bacterium]|nr:hypothetical protein [Polyangiaceae bacterium]